MRKLFCIAILFLTIAAVSPAQAVDSKSIWAQAAEAYRAGNYDRACTLYKSLLDSEFRRSDVYYNLGNSLFRQGQAGMAAWMYEKALEMNPRNGDARKNLSMIRRQSNVEQRESFLIVPFSWLFSRFTPAEWAVIFEMFFLPSALLLALSILTRRERLRNGCRCGAFALGIFALAALAFLAPRALESQTKHYGVIVQEDAVVRSGPGQNEPEYFKAPPGMKLSFRQSEVVGWVSVKDPLTGKIGYLPESHLKEI